MSRRHVRPAGALAGPSRRSFLTAAGLGGAALGLGVAAGAAGTRAVEAAEVPGGAVHPFRGEHQAGITTPAQDRLHMASWDVTTRRRDDLVRLLSAWTAAAERMTRGEAAGPSGAVSGPYDAPPDDTGEALGLPASGLTLTFGFGRSLFVGDDGVDRFGLAERLPAALVDLPHFAGDALEPGRSGGDLCVQACADDPQVAVHAIRNLSRIAFGTASVRWSQLGYGRTSSTTRAQTTPRNLFGFKDGTANIRAEETDALDQHVWADVADGPSWMAGGTYLVARRVRMLVETWDRESLRNQEQTIGRTKGTGAPLSGGAESTPPDFALTGRDGNPVIPADSHVALTHPRAHGDVRMLRRGYNYTDGSDGLGRLDAGLFFLAFVRDPRTHFVPVQERIARADALSEYLRHTGSALFAVPPGLSEAGTFVGDGLFA